MAISASPARFSVTNGNPANGGTCDLIKYRGPGIHGSVKCEDATLYLPNFYTILDIAYKNTRTITRRLGRSSYKITLRDARYCNSAYTYETTRTPVYKLLAN